MTALLWAGVTLVIAGVLIWRGDRFLHEYLRSSQPDPETVNEERQLALQERRNRIAIETGTIQATISLKNAQLEQQATDARLAAARAKLLQDTQTEADRSVIEARRKAACELAYESAREEQKQDRSPDTLVDAYGKYLGIMADLDRPPIDLVTFCRIFYATRNM